MAGAELQASYEHCIEITKTQAANFHFAFRILPQARYPGICALYAFARLADDFSDDETSDRRALENAARWRASFDKAMTGDASDHPILPAVADTMNRYGIDPRYMHELLDGTTMDASIKRYPRWEDTRLYCYRVASVIGIMTIHVFGFTQNKGEPSPIALAEETGLAFQLTNILRDIKEDGERRRIYLPLEDLQRFGVTEAELLEGRDSPAFRELIKFEVDRAQAYYASARRLTPQILPESRKAIDGLVKIYSALLDKIVQKKYDVLSERISLSSLEKLKLAGGLLLGA